MTTASGQEGAKPLTLSVGLQQDLDSANPTVGVTVAAYEVWNLQYATLTDKAAKDFAPIPGLAESWKAPSADKKTWTYKLRPNLKWSDGQPLTSEDVAYTINRARKEEWLNYSSTVANITAKATGPADGRDEFVGRRPEAADDGRVHPAEAHLGEVRQGRDHEVRRRSRRRRLGPVHARPSSRRASSGA